MKFKFPSKGIIFWAILIIAKSVYSVFFHNPYFDLHAAFPRCPMSLVNSLQLIDALLPFVLIIISVGVLATLRKIFRMLLIYVLFFEIVFAIISSYFIDENYKEIMFLKFAQLFTIQNPNMDFQAAYVYVKFSFIIWGIMVLGLYSFAIFFFTRNKVRGQFLG